MHEDQEAETNGSAFAEEQDLGIALVTRFMRQEIPAVLAGVNHLPAGSQWQVLVGGKLTEATPEQREEFLLALNTYAISQTGLGVLRRMLPEADRTTTFDDLRSAAEPVLGKGGAYIMATELQQYLEAKLTLTGIDAGYVNAL